MKKILLILVGGTICTALNDKGTLSVSDGAGAMIKDNFINSHSPFAKSVQIDLSDNLFILSENMTVDKWNLMIKAYRENMARDNYDGVIFAHGTDTLAYSASLFSMLLSNVDVPVFFVSSQQRLDLPTANGNANFRCAVECICQGIAPNVYVPYKNISDGKTYLHLASRLRQCANYSDDFFSVGAVDMSDEGSIKNSIDKISQLYPPQNRKAVVDINKGFELSAKVLMLMPYVGLDYSAVDYGKFSAVMHGTYHSGTACAEDGKYSILYMLKECGERGVDVYLTPSKTTGEIYDTLRIIANNNAPTFLYGTTNEVAYAKLVIAYSLFDNKQDIERFLSTEYNFEFMQ